MLTKKNILITGPPGIGKTTLIENLSRELENLHPVGFYTAEIREDGQRKGFELISLTGNRELLSHVEITNPTRVGKYHVNVEGFERFLDTILFSEPSKGCAIIDEIGKMECLSDKFRRLLEKLLDSDTTVIATIAVRGNTFMEKIKERADASLFQMTLSNRDSLLSKIMQQISEHRDR